MTIFGSIKNAFFRNDVGAPITPPPPTPEATGLHPAMLTELLQFDLIAPGTGKLAIGYVVSGTHEQLMSQMTAAMSKLPWHHPSNRGYYERDKGPQNTTNKAMRLGQIVASPQFERFMKLRVDSHMLRAQNQAEGTSHGEAVSRLLYQALTAQFRENPSVPENALISLRDYLSLVGCCEGTLAEVMGVLIPDLGRDTQHAGSWQRSSEFSELLRKYPKAVLAAIERAKKHDASYEVILRGAVELFAIHNVVAIPPYFAITLSQAKIAAHKPYREAARTALAGLDGPFLAEYISEQLTHGDADQRLFWAKIGMQNHTPEVLAVLTGHLASEKSAKVIGAIKPALKAKAEALVSVKEEEIVVGGYRGISGSAVEVPAFDAAMIAPLDITYEDYVDQLIALVDQSRAERSRNWQSSSAAENAYYQPISQYTRRQLLSWLNTDRSSDTVLLVGAFAADFRLSNVSHKILELLKSAPRAFSLRVAVLMAGLDYKVALTDGSAFYDNRAAMYLKEEFQSGCDLRVLDVLSKHAGELSSPSLNRSDDGTVALREMLSAQRNYLERFPREAVWPWLVDKMIVFDEALGLAQMPKGFNHFKQIDLLTYLPEVPSRYYAPLLEIAFVDKRDVSAVARSLLDPAPDLNTRLVAALSDPRQAARITAATWLADRGASDCSAALNDKLEKEKSDPVRVALVAALKRLGSNVTVAIGSFAVAAEAQSALAKRPPKLPAWLSLNGLPQMRIKSGEGLPKDVFAHWLSLAIKLKDPSATGQFGLFLDQLVPEDAQAVSGWVLENWISYDTQKATLEEANAYAVRVAPKDQYVEIGMVTLADRIVEIRDEKLGKLLNSGSDTKGMLALACRAKPSYAAGRVRWFLKNHGKRSNQAIALLDLLAGMESSTALQVVIAASVRIKQKNIQQHAARIAERYAQDRGWSTDVLADRTVPSAGFDDDGHLDLPCRPDEKAYYARLDAKLNIHLFKPDNKPVKALPVRDDEASKDAKKALADAKKELKQVIDMQTSRLFEAMCVERQWLVGDWKQAFLDHPVMRRLIERLVWQGFDSDGQCLGFFRPTQEGDFTNTSDELVAIDEFTYVRLAHGSLVDAQTSSLWLGHFKDYEVKPLLTQFGPTCTVLSPEQGEMTVIDDRTGWVGNALSYRGLSEKRGYERVSGSHSEYIKAFVGLDLLVAIHHSGSHIANPQTQAALTGLTFSKGQFGKFLKLQDVPKIVLAECWADYHFVAAKGNYDPDWEKTVGS